MILPLALLALSATLASATPTLNFPLVDQWPEVARMGDSYAFQLLPGTFNSTTSTNVSYTTSTLPSWLSWNQPSLTLYGTPGAADVGESNVTLTASDGSGTTSSAFTLLVTNYTVPGVHESFTTQISKPSLRAFASATALPAGTGVSIPPYWSFSLGFASDTFRLDKVQPTNGVLLYAAHQRGTTTLPSWLKFNNETMTFDGTAPASGTYTVVVTGTDFWGYTGAQTSFVIEVGQGEAIELPKADNLSSIDTMAGAKVDYLVDLSDVLVGGKKAVSAALVAQTSDLVVSIDNTDFPWLSYNSSSNSITGMTPTSYLEGTVLPVYFPLTISSTNASSTLALTTFVGINVQACFFKNLTLNASATPGQAFAFNLAPYVGNASVTINATVSPTDAAAWLTYNPGNMTLTGTAPTSPNYNQVNVAFDGTSGMIATTAHLAIDLAGVTKTASTSGTATVPTSSSSDTSASSSKHSGLSSAAKIALGVVFGLLALILLALLLFCCCRRRKNRASEKQTDDNDSFVAGSPTPAHDPFRRSNTLEPARNILGVPFFGKRTSAEPKPRPTSLSTDHTLAATVGTDKPTRLDGLKGIFGWGGDDEKKDVIMQTPSMGNRSASFLGEGDVIGVTDAHRPSNDASSFTQSFDSESSRASWESRGSFHWSSGENEGSRSNNRISAAPSIARPRQDFTPRYPRAHSPTTLARLTSGRKLDQSPDFSEFGSEGVPHHDSFSSQQSDSFMGSGSSFPSGPSGLNRFGESGGMKSIDEDEDDTTSVEGPAVVSLAERQSFETRRPQRAVSGSRGPRLKPSRERIISPRKTPPSERSSEALQEDGEGAFDDAEEARRSVYAPSNAGDVQGLGYPASAIFFGSPIPPNGSDYDARSSAVPSEARSSTIRAIPQNANPLSPALPQVGSFIRHRRTNTSGSGSGSRPTSNVPDGRVVACANETFSIHPQLNPPPTVSLSAATWSSAPPSTYRAEIEGGGQLPSWLHFDNRELELWGVPSLGNSGSLIVIKIVEKLGSQNRRSDPMSFGYVPQQEREVGKVTIEVVDRLRSPQFALDGSPHAF